MGLIFKPGARYGRLWVHAWFPEIVLRKVCVRVCVCVCMYVCMYFVFPHPCEQTFYLKAACIQTIKAKQIKPILHSCTGKLCLEGVFLSLSKTRHSDRPQTSKPAFLVDSSGILQLKNSLLDLMGLQGMRISLFGKWA